ncbi:hypothetical protein OQH61_03630 [Helicobacter sp. MIT 21-1697]|uniref:hypothetical protein n=1 Tax=Helicobacter sp. MIT 21-1697 TaxID=2993733 RepID=UPI00224B66F0|nr:hypothetical protein [Helicobacter sp. MIT 21-1697]MCX2716825.1 hypothetical protein [Helicobacter sp. MIT 21-1697]
MKLKDFDSLEKSFIAEIFYLSLERSYNRIGIEYGNFDTGYSFFIPRKYKIKNKNGQWGDCNTIFSLFELSFIFDFKFEVIGNIHENKELLKTR